MKRIDLLINQSRRATENVEYSETTGISDEEFIQYLNDAQDRIEVLIQNEFPNVFMKEVDIQAVAGQEAYDIPEDALISNRVTNVQYSDAGSVLNFRNLKTGTEKERLTGMTATPSFYIRRHKQILLQPTPHNNAGLIRVLYQKKLPRLDKRRGQVSSLTLSGNSIVSLVLDVGSLDADPITDVGYLTVVNSKGVIQMRRVPVNSIDTTTGEVDVEAGFEFEDGETISANDYVVAGFEATTHSELPDICERYLIGYCNWKILKRDSSDDAQEAFSELQVIESDIVSSYGTPDGDVPQIPIISTEYLGWND